MDQTVLVKDQIVGGEKLLRKLREVGFDMVAACWAKSYTDEQWYLYIVSPSIPEKGARPGFIQIENTLDTMGSEWTDEFERIDTLDIKLISPSIALGKEICRAAQRYRDNPAARRPQSSIDLATGEAAYIYPATLFDKQPAAAS